MRKVFLGHLPIDLLKLPSIVHVKNTNKELKSYCSQKESSSFDRLRPHSCKLNKYERGNKEDSESSSCCHPEVMVILPLFSRSHDVFILLEYHSLFVLPFSSCKVSLLSRILELLLLHGMLDWLLNHLLLWLLKILLDLRLLDKLLLLVQLRHRLYLLLNLRGLNRLRWQLRNRLLGMRVHRKALEILL